MWRPVLSGHNYKSGTTVLMEVKSRENGEGPRFSCGVSQASGHLGASVFNLKSLWQCQDPLAAGARALAGEKRGSKRHSSLLPAQPWPAEAGRRAPWPFHHCQPHEDGQREAGVSTGAARVTSGTGRYRGVP